MAGTPFLTTLPDDVLFEIFLCAIAYADGRLSTHEAPCNLSQTCRSLRAFALSESRFWTRINLTNLRGSAFHETMKLSKSLIPLWVARSGNALLDISMDATDPSTRDENVTVAAATSMLVAQSRWKRLVLPYSTSHTLGCYDWTVTDLSQLRELAVTIISTQYSLELNGLFKLFAITPTQTPIAPKLVHLHISYAYSFPEGLEVILDHCPALECLTIGHNTEHVWPLRDDKGIVGASGTLNCLSRIGISEEFDFLSCLNNGRAPALEAIEVRARYSQLEEIASSLLSPHIGPLVRRASLEFLPRGDDETPAGAGEYRDNVYRALPNVTQLCLAFHDSNASCDLVSLSFEVRGRQRFPELEYFKMIVTVDVGTRPLENMLASRMLHSDQFKAVIDINKWTVRRSNMFIERERIKSWVDSGRLEVIFDDRKTRSLVLELS